MKSISMIQKLSTIIPLLLSLIPISAAGQTDQHNVENMKMLIKMTQIQQPANCSEFLDNLEVKITTFYSNLTKYTYKYIFQIIMQNSLKLTAEIEGKLIKEIVTIDIPKTWDFTKCGRHRITSHTKSFAAADIEISGKEQSLGNISPWTVQHQGCGEKGLVVRIYEGFFATIENVLEHDRKII